MILLLDTSTGLCKLWFYEGSEEVHYDEWQADRGLADGILSYLEAQLNAVGKMGVDLTGLGVFRGPGSFTGLRIGMAVLNTIADDKSVPIVGTIGEDWLSEALGRLNAGEDDKLVLPEYGQGANITKPRK